MNAQKEPGMCRALFVWAQSAYCTNMPLTDNIFRQIESVGYLVAERNEGESRVIIAVRE
jgi:hypothetical protein